MTRREEIITESCVFVENVGCKIKTGHRGRQMIVLVACDILSPELERLKYVVAAMLGDGVMTNGSMIRMRVMIKSGRRSDASGCLTQIKKRG